MWSRFSGFPQHISYLSCYPFLPRCWILRRSFHISIQPSAYQLATVFDSHRLETYAGQRGGRQIFLSGILWTLYTLGTAMISELYHQPLLKPLVRGGRWLPRMNRSGLPNKGSELGAAGDVEVQGMSPSRTWLPVSSQGKKNRAADRDWGHPRPSLGTRLGHGARRVRMRSCRAGTRRQGRPQAYMQLPSPEVETPDRVSCTSSSLSLLHG